MTPKTPPPGRALPPPVGAPQTQATTPTPADDPLGQLLDRSVAASGPPGDRGGPGVAVALEWDGGENSAPVITASGRGEMAEAILARAFEAGVKVRKDADLVQILSVIEIGHEIPPEAFVAVAEVLSYVYNLNAALDPRAAAGAGPTDAEKPS